MEIIIEVIVRKLFYFEFVILQYVDEHNYNLGRPQQLWAMEKSTKLGHTKGVGFSIDQICEGGCIGRWCAGLARAVSVWAVKSGKPTEESHTIDSQSIQIDKYKNTSS